MSREVPSRSARRCTVGCTLWLVLSGVVASSAQEVDEAIEEEIDVLESRIVLDFGSLSDRQARSLRPSHLVVVEDGAERKVSSLQRLSEVPDWRSVVYVDVPLAKNRTIRTASLALGAFIEEIADRGTVEIVVADPAPYQLLGPTRQARVLEEALARLAFSDLETDQLGARRRRFKAALRENLSAADEAAIYVAEELALVRRQADHLLELAADGGDGRPSFLFLISEGFFEDPNLFYFDEPSPDAAAPGALIARDLAQTLAAYEWVVVALPMKRDSVEQPAAARSQTGLDRFNEDAGGVTGLPWRSVRRELDFSVDSFEVDILPILQPLRRIADDTAGAVVRFDSQLEGEIRRLQGLWRAHYLTHRTFDGRALPIEARFARRARRISLPFARTSAVIRTPAWARSSTPSSVAEARLRHLLAGGVGRGEISFEVRKRTVGEGMALLVDWGVDADLIERSPVRVSRATVGSDGSIQMDHLHVDGGKPGDDGLWTYEMDFGALKPDGSVALLLEVLRPSIWGAALVVP